MKSPHHPSLFTLLLLISFASVNAVLYTPALPAISQYFEVSSDMVQQTITIFLLGYTVGQLIYGPIANRFRRIPAIAVGASIKSSAAWPVWQLPIGIASNCFMLLDSWPPWARVWS